MIILVRRVADETIARFIAEVIRREYSKYEDVKGEVVVYRVNDTTVHEGRWNVVFAYDGHLRRSSIERLQAFAYGVEAALNSLAVYTLKQEEPENV